MNVWAILWLVLLILFVVLEAVTVQLLSVWFAAGALAAMLVSLIGGAVWLQVVAFFVVSIVLLALLWPMARRHVKAKVTPTNADALIGRVCTVTEAIDPIDGGRVKVGDVTWRAGSEKKISAGSQVKILKIQGTKVLVEEVKKEVEV